jgi:cytochrome c biogenesis factor
MFLVNNLLFVLFTFTVLIGTVFPLVVEALRGTQMSVGRPYFDRMAVPVGVALLFLMGVGPALPWAAPTPTSFGTRCCLHWRGPRHLRPSAGPSACAIPGRC